MNQEEIAAVFERMLRESCFGPEEKRCAANILGQISANESLELESGESA